MMTAGLVEVYLLHVLHAGYIFILWTFIYGDTFVYAALFDQKRKKKKKKHFTFAFWIPVRLSATSPISLNNFGEL
jgi:hypothetical protein